MEINLIGSLQKLNFASKKLYYYGNMEFNNPNTEEILFKIRSVMDFKDDQFMI